MTRTARTLVSLWISAALIGCGGAQSAEPAETPTSTEEPPLGDEPAASEAGEPSAEAEEEPDKAEASEQKEPAKPSRSPKEILTAEGVLFSFSFSDSEAYEGAESECSEKSADDPKKKAECMAKARDKIDHDGMIFKKEADGSWTWTTLRRAGAKVTVLHKIEFEFGEEKDNTITIKPKGRDKGKKPKAFPASVVIETNDSGIVLNDPNLGKMVYVGKLGAVGDPGR